MAHRSGLTARIFLKLISAVVCILVVAGIGVDLLATRVARTWYTEMITRELGDKAQTLALLEGDKLPVLTRERLRLLSGASSARFTIIGRDGQVLNDSSGEPSNMENHASRPEVQSALRGERGSNIRRSATLGAEFLYVAVPMPPGALRMAVPMTAVDSQVDALRGQLLVAVIFGFLPVVLLALLFARMVSRRLGRIIGFAETLAEGHFEARLQVQGNDELSMLSERMNETAVKLQRMFEEQEREHAELEKLERIRKDFVINVSHELRTPLASIQGYTETLLDGAIHDPAHNIRFLNIIRQNAERLGRLTADLLTLSRIELKTQKFQFAGYYVNDLLRDCVDSMQPLAEKKNIRLVLETAPAETEVFCDSEAMHQIMSNLIDNALKYTPENQSIYVGALKLTAGKNPMVEIYVRDTGCGIPADDLPRLFERFYRVDKARSRELGGTGLGLAIVKHLVRAMGGEIKVESQMNAGSRFAFTVPEQDLGLTSTEEFQQEMTSTS